MTAGSTCAALQAKIVAVQTAAEQTIAWSGWCCDCQHPMVTAC